MVNIQMEMDKYLTKTILCKDFRIQLGIVQMELNSQKHYLNGDLEYLACFLKTLKDNTSSLNIEQANKLPPFFHEHPFAPCNTLMCLAGKKLYGRICTYLLKYELETDTHPCLYFLGICEVLLLRLYSIVKLTFQNNFYKFLCLPYVESIIKKFVSQER